MVDPVAVVSAVTAERGRKRGEVVDFVVSYANDRPGTPRVGTQAVEPVAQARPQAAARDLPPVLRGRAAISSSMRCRLPGIDGGDRFLDLRAARLDDSEIIATWRDVTDRVRADEALAQSEALLRGAFDDAPVGALLISVDETEADGGRLLKVNRAFAALVGYRQQQLLGMPLRALLHPDDLMTRDVTAGSAGASR